MQGTTNFLNEARSNMNNFLTMDLRKRLGGDLKQAVARFVCLDTHLKGILETLKDDKYKEFMGENTQIRDIYRNFYAIADSHNNLKYHLDSFLEKVKALPGGE